LTPENGKHICIISTLQVVAVISALPQDGNIGIRVIKRAGNRRVTSAESRISCGGIHRKTHTDHRANAGAGTDQGSREGGEGRKRRLVVTNVHMKRQEGGGRKETGRQATAQRRRPRAREIKNPLAGKIQGKRKGRTEGDRLGKRGVCLNESRRKSSGPADAMEEPRRSRRSPRHSRRQKRKEVGR